MHPHGKPRLIQTSNSLSMYIWKQKNHPWSDKSIMEWLNKSREQVILLSNLIFIQSPRMSSQRGWHYIYHVISFALLNPLGQPNFSTTQIQISYTPIAKFWPISVRNSYKNCWTLHTIVKYYGMYLFLNLWVQIEQSSNHCWLVLVVKENLWSWFWPLKSFW